MSPLLPRYQHLLRALQRCRPLNIMEVGVYNGDNALKMILMASSLQSGKRVNYHGFDFFGSPLRDEYDFAPDQLGMGSVSGRLRTTGAGIHLISGDSRETLPEFIKFHILMDFVFIDGGHSLETVQSDWDCVRKILKRGSVVCFDDYWDSLECGCRKTVDAIDPKKYSVIVHAPGDSGLREDKRLAPSGKIKLAEVHVL